MRKGGAQEVRTSGKEVVKEDDQMMARQASRPRLRLLGLLVLISALCLGLVDAGAAVASTGTVTMPHWQVEARAAPTNLPVEGNAGITVSAANIGDAEAKAPIRVVDL